MLLKIPFHIATGDENRCYEAAMLSAIAYFIPETTLTLEQLDRLVERKPGKWTYTQQIVPVLYDLGLDVQFYSEEPLGPLAETDGMLESLHRANPSVESFDYVLRHTDLEVAVRAAKNCMRYRVFTQRRVEWTMIEAELERSHVPLLLIDYNLLVGRKGPFQGHFVALTGFDKEHIFYHENSERHAKPNMAVDRERFRMAWDNPGTGHDLVIVAGRRGE